MTGRPELPLTQERFGDLAGSLDGRVIRPEDADYDQARRVFNAMADRRPALIARCGSTADVVAAIEFGRENGLEIAVRCGGHSVAGLGVCEGGLVIDLAGLKRIEVDPASRTARAGGGVLWGEFDAATQAHGLHTPGGRVTTTGIGGFTLGGGYGWTSSKYGLACDNLLAAEVVLADGRVVAANEVENPDLFWGLRGGGGNFGVVTEFCFRLHELGPTVLAGLALWPLDRAHEVLRRWRDLAETAPDELSTAAVVLTAPPESFVPDELKGRTVIGTAAIYVGDPSRGTSVVQPLTRLNPAVDLIGPVPYTAFQAATDPLAPMGMRGYWRGEYMDGLTDAAIDTVLEHAPAMVRAEAPFSQVIIFRIGQAVARVPDAATAFPHRDARYLLHPITVWTDADRDSAAIAANRALAAAMGPFGTGGSYLNFTAEADRVRAAFGDEKYARLVALKDAYDPGNLFRLNQNIPPSRRAAGAGAGSDAIEE